MTKRTYYIIWAGMFILCAGLGFIPEPTGFLRGFLTVLSLLFFLPPAVLLRFAGKRGDTVTVKLLRNLSFASLALTLGLILLNFLCFMAPRALGNVLYGMLVIVSAPMICSGYWALSLFCWACVLFAAQGFLKKK